MSEKVRVFRSNIGRLNRKRGERRENILEIKKLIKEIEKNSFKALIMKANSIKSEGKLAKEINFSDFGKNI